MKKYLVFAAAASLFAACSSDDLATESPTVAQPTVDDGSIQFDAYVNRGLTRAGANGPVTTTNLQSTAAGVGEDGFGVFGYYTNGESYTGSSRPDFFYNQQVKWDGTGSKFTYTPLKYWPNEFGSDAISDQVDKLTLFAYAPYVEVAPLTGLVTDADKAKNITGMTRNNATGDPMIKYTSSMESDNSVDLCWGVAKYDFTSSNSAQNANDIKAGDPYVDVVKPGTDANSKINFDFKHALAQLNVTIDANVTDLTSTTGADDVNKAYTRIWVRSVTFEGITQTGALNLNSKAASPNWYDVNGTSLITTGSLTVYDGRKDGREANEVASSETPAKLNATIVQSVAYPATGDFSTFDPAGVTKNPVNLFANKAGTANNAAAPIFVIPTKEKMKVLIVYDVETADDNLATVLSDGSRKGSTIENRIYKTIDAFGEIEAGKNYTLKLHLGMRSVDFDASVTEWQDMQADVDLPSNLQTFTALPTPFATKEVILSATQSTYDFAVNGLIANAAVTVTPTTVAATGTSANGSGISKISVTSISANTTTTIFTAGSVEVGDGTNKLTLTIKQSPAPLGLSSLAYASGPKLTYTITASGLDNANAIKTAGDLKVYKNGVDITASCTLSTTAHEITLPGDATSGDVFKVYMKANAAAAETATCSVP